ncbi:MAG: ABC transporter substrate-binding protein [Treponema sp.]|jgi:polar amino acid transport system substrate-binding protein|nr:ABC transporter substrate-binding protein [Treponema sp.]
MKLKGMAIGALIFMILCGALFAGGTRESSGLTLEKGVLTIGMEIGYPPMEYLDVDGKTPIGFDVSMAKALAGKLGLECKFVDTAWDGIFAGIDTNKYDCIISSVTVTDERLAAHNFTKPYIGNSQAMVLLKGSSIKARTPEELEGLGVAYQAETTSDIYMARLADAGLKFTPYEYDKVMNCFDELRLGRVDAIICDSLVAVDYIAPADTPFEIVWLGPADEVFAICLKKGNTALTDALNKAMDELFAEGAMLKISQETFKMDLVSNVKR